MHKRVDNDNANANVNDPASVLKDKLIANMGKLNISKDGFVSLNVEATETQTEIKRQLKKLREFSF